VDYIYVHEEENMPVINAPIVKPNVPVFPADTVATVLKEELLGAVRAQARRKGRALPLPDDEVVITAFEIDSLTVVELLCNLDDVLPFEVNECVVRPGGYRSIDAAVKHLLGRIESKWKNYHTKGK
jgi:hypothetical protein